MALVPGILLNNRYRIITTLAQGGMGAVYRAADENLGTEVAVKENLFLSDEYARQFQLEASILASLRHTNLPRVGDYFVLPGQGQYLVMDYVEGEDLRQRIERLITLPEKDVVLIGVVICDSLTYLHTRKPAVVHRDIKPGNIKISPEGGIYLVDFGLAKVMQDSQATTTGARAMTPGYSPPEQYGIAHTDARSDIYSLGATLYAALCGVISEDALARATGKAQLTPLRKIKPRLNPQLTAVIEKAMEVEPDDRFQTAEEFKRALLSCGEINYIPDDSVTISPPPLPVAEAIVPVTGKKAQKRRTRALPWLSLVFIVIMAVAGLWYTQPGPVNSLLSRYLPGIVRAQPPTATPVDTAAPTLKPESTATSLPVVVSPPTVTATPTRAPTLMIDATPTLAGTPPRPTWTPTTAATPTGGAGEIAFVSNRSGSMQIWLMNSDGSNQRQITSLMEGACQPDFSPDGLQIVFTSPCFERKENYEGATLYIIDADGTDLRQAPLPPSPAGDFDPAWSPDGSRIAFTSLRAGMAHIFTIELAQCTSPETCSLQEVSDTHFNDKQPAWRPTGEPELAFVRKLGNQQIMLASVNGQTLKNFTRSGGYNNVAPVWAPDGERIYFSQIESGPGFPFLVTMRYADANTLNEQRIKPTGSDRSIPINEPAISRDGFWVAFESWPDGSNHDIYLMDLNGGNLKRLTNDLGLDFSPVWRPVPVTAP